MEADRLCPMGALAPARGSHELAPGAALGRKYQVLRRLAVGGMAELYLARTRGVRGFEKLVVVKRVLPHLAEEPEFIEMFFTEARLAATLDHPNVVHVMDIGPTDEDPWFVMEYVHGEDLRAMLRKSRSHGPLPLEVALAIVLGAATGLHYVHERVGLDGRPLGLVHRDVSPSNVLVTYDGSIKVADFGIVKAAARTQMTRAGMMKGKVGYMSPEQCRGDDVDRRSDVFGLGILLYEATTGHRLFHGDNDYAVLHRIVSGRYMPLVFDQEDYPEPLQEIVARALQRDRDDRYPTAEAFATDLEAFAHEAGLRLSSTRVAACVRDRLGDKPYPSTDVSGLVDFTDPAEDDPATRPVVRALGPAPTGTSSVRRAWITAAVVSSLAVGFGVVGFVRGTSSKSPRNVEELGSRAEAPLHDPERQSPPPSIPPSAELGESSSADASSGDVEGEPLDSPSTATVPPSVTVTKTRKRPARRRSRRSAVDSSRAGQVDALFPPSHDEGR